MFLNDCSWYKIKIQVLYILFFICLKKFIDVLKYKMKKYAVKVFKIPKYALETNPHKKFLIPVININSGSENF